MVVLLLSIGYNNPSLGFSAANNEPGVLGVISLAILWGYGIYWSLDIRRALSAIDFRRQALGMGLLAAGWGSFNLANIGLPTIGPAQAGLALLALSLTFYWIDASIKAAGRTDPLARDPLHWSKLRIALWIVLVSALLSAAAATFVVALQAFVYGPLGALLVLLLIVLPLPSFLISVRRSKNVAMKRHLTWFGVALGCWTAALAVSGNVPNTNLSNAALYLAFVLFSYFIYRSAKSLAPMERVHIAGVGGEA